MITFILNNRLIKTDNPAGTSLLDFIRYQKDLSGTKIGCREGDCGACTVLEGRLEANEVVYKSIVSCLTPLGNVQGKHIVTIEGLNMKHLSPVQNAMVDNAATQCGFCTPGLVMSLTGHGMSKGISTKDLAMASVSGNICRCTGYKSIERAAESISKLYQGKSVEKPIEWLVKNNFLPEYFLTIQMQLADIENPQTNKKSASKIIGGGTDLMVQKADEIYESELDLFYDREDLRLIKKEHNNCIIGASVTANELMHSPIMLDIIPTIKDYFKLISSEPIRNMGTVAGNIMNASPIADLSIFFLALNTSVQLKLDNNTRIVPLKNFFLAYKKFDIKEGEYIESISFPIPEKEYLFNFEKVSKRTYLDIASVNTAFFVKYKNEVIEECRISVGGVSPVPLFLKLTSEYLSEKHITNGVIIKANSIMQEEISPISDIRGSEEYKRLLLRQLLFAHFIKLFPEKISLRELVS